MSSKTSFPAAGNRKLSLTACAVMVAASVGGGSSLPAAVENGAIDQIQRYCATSWRNARIAREDWADCTQEAFAGLLGRIPRARIGAAIYDGSSEERRELNRSIWCTIKRWQRTLFRRSLPLNGHDVPDRRADTEPVLAGEMDGDLAAALETLSPRQRRILALWCDGQPIADIARDLGIPTPRASDEKYKAIRKLRRALGASGD